MVTCRPNEVLHLTRPSRRWSSLRDPDAVYRDCNPRFPGLSRRSSCESGWAGSLSPKLGDEML